MFKEEGGDITMEAGPFYIMTNYNATLTITSTNIPVWSSYYAEIVQVDETDPTQYKSLARGTIAREWSSWDTTNFLGETESVHLLYSYGTNTFLPAIDAAIAVHVTSTDAHAASTISSIVSGLSYITGANVQLNINDIDAEFVTVYASIDTDIEALSNTLNDVAFNGESDPVWTNAYATGLNLSSMTNPPTLWTSAQGATNASGSGTLTLTYSNQTVYGSIDDSTYLVGDLEATNSPTAEKVMLYASDLTKTNMYYDVWPYRIEGITNSVFLGTETNNTKIYVGSTTNSPYIVNRSNEFYFGNVETNAFEIYSETDPIWNSDKSDYYTETEADALFATGTPLYVESDPIWTNAYATGLNLASMTNAPASWTAETDSIWTNAYAIGLNLSSMTNAPSAWTNETDPTLTEHTVTIGNTAYATATLKMRYSGGYINLVWDGTDLTVDDDIVADSFSGALDATDVTSGTLPLARLVGITSTQIANGSIDELDLDTSVNVSLAAANTAYGYGNHSTFGYITNNQPSSITSAMISDGTIVSGDISNGTVDVLDLDAGVQASLTLADGSVQDAGNETIAGIKTFSSDPVIPDEAYASGWNASLEPPTKNAVYDKIETLGVLDTSGTPIALDYARFTDADTIEGRSYAEMKADLSLEIGTDVQAWDADLDGWASIATSTYNNTSWDTAYGWGDHGINNYLQLVVSNAIWSTVDIGDGSSGNLTIAFDGSGGDSSMRFNANGTITMMSQLNTPNGLVAAGTSTFAGLTASDAIIIESGGLTVTGAVSVVGNYAQNGNFDVDGTGEVTGVMTLNGTKLNLAQKTANYTLTSADRFIVATNTITLTLPTAIGISETIYTIKNIGTGAVTVDGNGSETIDGELTVTLNSQYQAINVISDGDEWFIY